MTTRIRSLALGAASLFSTFALTSLAQAALVSYDFTASINAAKSDKGELALVGLPSSGVLTGSFSFDSNSGWYGGSNNWVDSSLTFTLDQLPKTTTTATWLAVEYNQDKFTIHQDGYQPQNNNRQVGAQIDLFGQSQIPTGVLPSSLSLGSAGGLLQLFVGGNFSDIDLVATITSLTPSGARAAVSTPELDPASGGVALVLVLGGGALMLGRRRQDALLV